jgi:hypothetical protein
MHKNTTLPLTWWIFCAAIVFLFSAQTTFPAERHAQSPAKPLFWYEDSNCGMAGGFPDDFERMFTQPDAWKNLRARIDVYYIRGNTLNAIIKKYGEGFIRNKFVKVLAQEGIVIAIDNPGPHQSTLPLLKRCGATVGYIALQSTLSKIKAADYKKDGDRLVAERITAAVTEITALKKLYPGIKVGLIDATPTKGRAYEAPYRELARRLAKNGASLDFIHLDCPVEMASAGETISWEKVFEVEAFVRNELKIPFGFICTSSSGGMESEAAFYKNVLEIPKHYHGHKPDHFIIMGWFTYPKNSLPEKPSSREYSMTKAALDLFTELARGDK